MIKQRVRNAGNPHASRHVWLAFSAAMGAAVVLVNVQAVPAADICFQATAFVSSSTIHLRDVAIVRASDPALMTSLEQVVLAPAPPPGRRMRLDFADIRSRLEAAGMPVAELNYSGSTVVVVASADAQAPVKPKRLKITKALPIVSPAQVKRAERIMTEAVRRSMHDKHTEKPTMYVDVVVDPADARTVLANAARGFEIGGINPKNAEPQIVQVGYQDVQGQPARLHVHCIISERPQVPVLTRSVSAGEVIHESDLAWLPVDSTSGLVTRVDEIVDKEAKRSIHADEPIRTNEVRNVPLIRANDIVTGTWRSGGIRITGQFKAKEDGGLGDVITLVKLNTRDQLVAKVTDVHEAEILSADRAKSATDGADADSFRNGATTLESVAHRTVPSQTAMRSPPAGNTTAPAIFVDQR